MFCVKCQRDAAECICPDREERLKKLMQSPNLYIGADYRKRIKEDIEKKKDEQTQQE